MKHILSEQLHVQDIAQGQLVLILAYTNTWNFLLYHFSNTVSWKLWSVKTKQNQK